MYVRCNVYVALLNALGCNRTIATHLPSMTGACRHTAWKSVTITSPICAPRSTGCVRTTGSPSSSSVTRMQRAARACVCVLEFVCVLCMLCCVLCCALCVLCAALCWRFVCCVVSSCVCCAFICCVSLVGALFAWCWFVHLLVAHPLCSVWAIACSNTSSIG